MEATVCMMNHYKRRRWGWAVTGAVLVLLNLIHEFKSHFLSSSFPTITNQNRKEFFNELSAATAAAQQHHNITKTEITVIIRNNSSSSSGSVLSTTEQQFKKEVYSEEQRTTKGSNETNNDIAKESFEASFILTSTTNKTANSSSKTSTTKEEEATTTANCTLDPIKSFVKRKSKFGYFPDANDSNFLVGDGLKLESNYSVCEFEHTGHTHHFVHAMEQFYRCVTWWLTNPTKHPVLLFDIPNKLGGGQHYKRDFLNSLVHVFNVTIVPSHTAPSVKQNMEIRDGLAPFGLTGGPEMAQNFSQRILEYHKLGHVIQDAAKRRETLIPRIAIFNRDFSIARTLLNANDLQKALRKAAVAGSGNSSSNNTNTSLLFSVAPVTYFEHASFLNQVKSFASMDIVISPHGAQLASIPFLPPCGSVLELYPKDYWIPNYFGTLASGSGIAHSYFHLSDAEDKYLGFRARDQKLCSPIEPIVEAVHELIEDWKQCVTTRFGGNVGGSEGKASSTTSKDIPVALK